MTSPEQFWWGTAASSTQSEGAAPASDWARWEGLGRAPASGDGNGFGTRFAGDFRLYAAHGLTHHRLSIEWARIEPEDGRQDRSAIEHYREILRAAGAAGVAPWVCLHHFTLPGWFVDDAGGFLDDRAGRYRWARHVDFCAETFGDLVRGWKPVNEPVAYAAAAFLYGQHPPGRTSVGDFHKALGTVHRANADAARLLRGGDAPVATIHNLSPVHAADAEPVTRRAASAVDDVIWRSWTEPDLLDPFDLIGFSYYNAMTVHADGSASPYPATARTGPLGYAPWSPGLGVVLHRLADEHPERPLLVAECGIGTDDEGWRDAYLGECLAEVEAAVSDGIDVRGFFHWTGVDNYEWLKGFEVPFGLFDSERNPKPSAAVLADAAVTP